MAELIIFEAAQRQMGVRAENVIEIIRAVAVTTLPDCQPPFIGVLNYRGAMVPVARLNTTTQPSLQEQMLFVRCEDAQPICLVVDRVLTFTAAERVLDLSEVNKAGFQNLKLTRQLAKVGNELVPLLNLEVLQNQLEQLAEPLEQAFSANRDN